MDQPLVSVIMPAYNAEKYIAEAITSVIDQTYENWELIIIDDESIDNTKDVILEYAEKEERIKYLYQPNGKQGKARNLGISKSKGAYIAFLDADDLWVKEKLEIQIDHLIKNPEIDLIFSQGYYLEHGKIDDFNILVKTIWDKNDIALFIENNQIPILSVLMKKKCLSIINFPEDLSLQNVEDYYLWINLLLRNNIFMSITERLFKYRIHSDQTTYLDINTSIPLLNLYNKFIKEHYSFSNSLLISRRIKWFLFEQKTHSLTIETLEYIFKNSFYLRYLFLKISCLIFLKKIKSKFVFKLCP